jgi:hypothetical protein
MMTAKHRIVYLLIVFASLGGVIGCVCSGSGGSDTASGKEDVSPGINLLIDTQGKVLLKREGWPDYALTSFGVAINRGDLIRPAAGQSVTILCADLTLHTLEHEGGCPCKVQEPKLEREESNVLTPKKPAALIPYILHPRNTVVLNSHPSLRWYDTGAASYTVSIVQGSEEIWQQPGVHGSEMRYPDDAPSLQPGEDYLLMVRDEDTDRHSGEDPAKGLGFRVMSPENRETVEARSAEIRDLNLDDTRQTFALAVYYAGQGLRGEALASLDKIDPANLPAVSLWRGDLLLATRLPDEAEAAYLTALADAETAGDLEIQALAHTGLWRATGDQDHLEAALELYAELGDESAAEALRTEAGQ